MLGDTIDIKDAYVVNIGVEFEIVTSPNFNNNEVLNNCINALINYFLVDKMKINAPIILRELTLLLDSVPGTQTIRDIKIVNKVGISDGYSLYAYDVEGANQNGVIYPSLDPMIFEVKYPLEDIKGRVVAL